MHNPLLQLVLCSDSRSEASPGLAAGRHVRIRQGALAGLAGAIRQELLGNRRLMELAHFGPGVFVAIRAESLESDGRE